MQKRKTESKQYIKKALTLLLQDKPFEQISISDITRKAGINRGTFYLHYKDKYDMLKQFKEELLTNLYTILRNNHHDTDRYTILVNTFAYLQSDFEFIQAFSMISSMNFSKTIKDFVLDIILEFPQSKTVISEHYGVPYPYAIEVYLASIESLISLWVSTGGKETPQEMTTIISKVLKLDPTEP